MGVNKRQDRSIWINRLFLFLGLLGIMIVLAGAVFSKSESAISIANANGNQATQNESVKSSAQDSTITNAAGDSISDAVQ